MTGNCLGWVSYAVATQNLFVLFSNAPGLILSIWLNMSAAKLQYQEMHQSNLHHRDSTTTGDDSLHSLHLQVENDNDDGYQMNQHRRHRHDSLSPPSLISLLPSFTPHEIWVLRVIFIWLSILCAVCFIPMTSTQQANIIGSAVNVNLVIFYGAPLSTIVQVVRTRNSSSIHRRTMVMGLLNSFFWLCYGIALMDMIIFFPNVTGFILGIIQLTLCTFLPSIPTREADDAVQEHLVANNDSIVTSKEDISIPLDVDSSIL